MDPTRGKIFRWADKIPKRKSLVIILSSGFAGAMRKGEALRSKPLAGAV
jgi:hypothetical protein